MEKYKSKFYKNVVWRNTTSGRLYVKLFKSKGFFGKLYTATYHPPSPVNIDEKILSYMKGLGKGSFVLDIGGNVGSFDNPRIRKLLRKTDYRRLDIDEETRPDILADIKRIPLKPNTVDFIVCKSVLEHIDEPHKAVEEMRRVLKKGGLLYYYVPFMQRIHHLPHDYTRFTRFGLEHLFRKYSSIEVNANGGYVSSLANMLYMATYAMDNLFYIGFLLRVISYPLFWLLVRLDRLDKYRLNPIGYFGIAKK